ncbi:MAG: DMT family transporter [Spirochaetales bacterium]
MIDYVLATLAGGLVVLSMTLNSALGERIGVLRAAAVNYIVGLVGALSLLLVLGGGDFDKLATVPWWAWTGGVLGVAVVAGSNLVFPLIPVVLAVVLVTLGQLATGLALDVARTGSAKPLPLVGATLVLVGLFISQRRKP